MIDIDLYTFWIYEINLLAFDQHYQCWFTQNIVLYIL